MRRLVLVSTSMVVALCVLPAPAGADVFGPISLVSEGPFGGETQQAEYAHDPAISGDGEYVVFDGSIGGVTGVWRRDLQTGVVEQVAGGDAELPSIGADGQYVSFTTNEGLSLPEVSHGRPDASPHAEAVNVYVRDMDRQPAGSESEEAARPAGERAFTVVSAVNGSEEPLTYAGQSTNTGSGAIGRSAIDAEGDEVAFVTTAVSNLVRYPQVEKEEEEKGETPKPHTPKLQVAVRYLRTHETVLVSRCYVASKCEEAAAPAVAAVEGSTDYGAVYTGQSASFEAPPPYGEYRLSSPPGASLSADGSTVAWMGEDIGQQAALLSEETRNPDYTEPLWRRIQPGSETITERVTGGSDPANPACAVSGEGSLPASPSPSDPCQGPFVVENQGHPAGIINENGGQTGDFVPRLSANGYRVAFVSQEPLVTSGENFGRSKTGQESDLYVANMAPGLTRDQALTQVTELAGGEGSGLADTAPIFDFDISPDGEQVAFSTVRTRFPLGFPAFVSTPAGEPGMNELYDADLADGTLTRVTHGYQEPDEAGEHAHEPAPAGEDPYKGHPGDGALSPSFTDDGDTLAFSSTASNLVFGDGNSPPLGLPQTGSFDGSDAFTVQRVVFGATPIPNEATPAPEPAFAPAWNLGVTASSQANGTVLLYVRAPGAGTVHAGARGAVVAAFVHVARTASRGRHAATPSSRARVTEAGDPGARAARAGKRKSKARAIAKTVIVSTVATRTEDTHGAELTPLTLVLAPRYASLARERGGFSATVMVTFSAPGRATLTDTIPVTFVRAKKKSSKKRSAKGKGKSKSADTTKASRGAGSSSKAGGHG
jgi:hypothetical protein